MDMKNIPFDTTYFFSARIKEIELTFQNGKWNEEVPLQVYSTWAAEYKRSKDQTLRYVQTAFAFTACCDRFGEPIPLFPALVKCSTRRKL
jgi:hypothetical protein